MKLAERTGMWVEMYRSTDGDGEITIEIPNSLYVGWMMAVHLKEDELAKFLRSIGWEVSVPNAADRAAVRR